MTLTALAVLLAYLLGSLPVGALVARTRGIDIQKVGSGNPGATNVLRALGWGPGLLVAAFDIFKGALAVYLAHALGLSALTAALCGVAAVIGHNYSVFLRFRGGKGVATSFGTLAVIVPVVGLGAFVIAIFTMWLTRYVSAGSMVGAASAIVLAWILPFPLWLRGIVTFLALLLIWQHRQNVSRLHAGTESRLGQRVASPPAEKVLH
ncbi:glycerol-3-phosphate 1-O-acyltransferase PlsY [Deinococcus maricopensis]|uniref:Glycerol-3-phosphate acyltransferase n=1 Tax=Deinococcus maricopensis (strain DSM 21211 / LMG 22137 / NRRL B-23946 / LB-34) TaxID=709986 RepID=E8UB71_DEIML|nr:glycerol-3-phosphate 1-O-acyltransferase PlsY [Deinococcus maricopensis]ADV68310.1 Glycerol-3-phosphate acyltransferase [Deinococcus maricopensis DSM 21211]